MAKKKKKKQRDFKKVHLKVGKILKKPNETNAKFKSKSIVLVQQQLHDDPTPLGTASGQAKTQIQQSLIEICQQLNNHYNKNVRKDALIRLKHYLEQNSESIPFNLNILLPAIGGRLVDDELKGSQICNCLDLVLKSITTSELRPHFRLLIAHISCALTHLSQNAKQTSLSCLQLILKLCPDICTSDAELPVAFLNFLALSNGQGTKKIGATNDRLLSRKEKSKMLETVVLFLKVMIPEKIKSTDSNKGQVVNISYSEDKGTYISDKRINLTPNKSDVGPFDFPVLYSHENLSGQVWADHCENLKLSFVKLAPFLDNFWMEITTNDLNFGQQIKFSVEDLQIMKSIMLSFEMLLTHIKITLDVSKALAEAESLSKEVTDFMTNKFVQRYKRLYPCHFEAAVGNRKLAKQLTHSINRSLKIFFDLSENK